MIAVANFIGLPLLFLSSTMIARSQMPGWMQTVAKFNPVDWGVKAAREVVLTRLFQEVITGETVLLVATHDHTLLPRFDRVVHLSHTALTPS